MGMEDAGETDFDRPAAQASQDEEPSTANGGSSTVRFSISKRKQVVQRARNSDKQDEGLEFVSSVDEIGIQVVGGSRDSQVQKLIPKLENTWKPEKRMKNLMSAPEDSVKEFVSEIQAAGPVEGVQYGLSVRSTTKTTTAATTGGNVKMDIVQAREMKAKQDKEALDVHLDFLPDSASLEAYESMPVERFGEALMMGMGWTAGSGVGRRATEDVKACEYVRRPERLGLGAIPAPKKEVEKKYIKPGESREKKPDLVAPIGPDGKIRHKIEIGEKLVERPKKGAYGGKVMSIISGRHAGLRGEVMGRKDKVAIPGEVLAVKLVKSGETVQVDAKDLADVGSIEEERALKKLKELRIGKSEVKAENEVSEEGGRSQKVKPWLASQIRVRIVSKRFQGGKMYLKKGRVIDVLAPTVCTVLLDETGELVEGVKQEYLETALPKKGGRIFVVSGKHRGSTGKLLEKNNKAEFALVQMDESFEMVKLDLDHLAEFAGDAADYDT